jgi:hypothetical protein
VDKFEVVTIEERLVAWRASERAAAAAEHQVASLGQAAADPRVRDLYLKAVQLRQQADHEFAALLRAVRLDEQD